MVKRFPDAHQLERILSQPRFSSLDRQVARLLLRLAGGEGPALALATALVSRQAARGHVCLDLTELAGQPLSALVPESEEELYLPELNDWQRVLRASAAVGTSGEFKPLVLSGSRLYLHRLHQDEQKVAAGLLHRARSRSEIPPLERLREVLQRLFPEAPEPGFDAQRVAAAACALRRLVIISGGPGTGKTHTVVRILALLQELAAPAFLRVGVAAPTGKAAGRLQEAIRAARGELKVGPEVMEAIPDEVKTIHRLLGAGRRASVVRHHQGNPLPLDLLIVDEASMVDLTLMAKLLAALPPAARLVLLGDKDQLASVEAGAVLGDLCGGRTASRFSSELASQLAALGSGPVPAGEPDNELSDCLVLLSKSRRFGAQSGIGRLARAVNAGATDEAVAGLRGDFAPEVLWQPELDRTMLARQIRHGYASYLRAPGPEAAFAAFDRFRVLTPHRQGPDGVAILNGWIEQVLSEAGLIRPEGEGSWYAGRPVMITRNHYSQALYNGDIGLTLTDRAGRLRVFFPMGAGGFRAFSPARLPAHETAYALTVHKSQGSEFERVLFLLPGQISPVLTRELVYTAITRARCRFEMWGGEAVFRQAVVARTRRSTGLKDLLWGGG